jgi:hypothetical protein
VYCCKSRGIVSYLPYASSGLLVYWANRQMHFGTIYLEHRIRVGHEGFTPLLLHIAIIGSYGYALKAKGCTVSSFTCRLILPVVVFVLPVIRVYCSRELHCVVSMCCCVVLLGRCMGVSCVLCVVDFLLTFRIWHWVVWLCKCELDFKVAASVVGFSYSKVDCVFCRQRNCETQRSFLHQAFV